MEVVAPWIKQPFQLSTWLEINGFKFIRCVKTDPKLHRLIMGEAPGKKRTLTATSVVEDIRALRNAAVEAETRKIAAAPGDGKEDLGIDEEEPLPSKKMRVLNAALPRMINIEVPGVAGHPPMMMRVATGLPSDSLWVELSAENINYLRAAVEAQLDTGSASARAIPQSSSAGVHWVKSKASWRVRFTNEEGAERAKMFKASAPDDEEAIQEAAKKAEEFAASVRKQHEA